MAEPNRKLMRHILDFNDAQIKELNERAEERVHLYFRMGEGTTDHEVGDFCRNIIVQMLKDEVRHKYFDITFVITRNSSATVSVAAQSSSTGGVNPHDGGAG